MSDNLLKRADEWAAVSHGSTHWDECYLVHVPCLIGTLAAAVRELEAVVADWKARDEQYAAVVAERDAVQHLFAQQERHRDELLAENDALRALLRDIRAEGRITGNIAVRLIAALKE